MSHAYALSPEPFAPWAEEVPTANRLTVDDLARLPDDGWVYELVQGRLLRMPLSGGEASKIALRLGASLLTYVEEHGLGEVTGADGGYDLGPAGFPNTELGPDVAFVRADQVPSRGTPEYGRAWPVAPDLVVEVASPHQYRPEMSAKARLYLAAGTRLLWVVWPRQRQVDVWRPGNTAPAATLGEGDWMDGEDVVAGFRYPLTRLFV